MRRATLRQEISGVGCRGRPDRSPVRRQPVDLAVGQSLETGPGTRYNAIAISHRVPFGVSHPAPFGKFHPVLFDGFTADSEAALEPGRPHPSAGNSGDTG